MWKNRAVLLLGLSALLGGSAEAQRLSTAISGDGWEAYRGVEYLGGDSKLKTKMMGAVVLTDTTFGFYECQVSGCYETPGKPPFKGAPLLLIPLRSMNDVVGSDQVRNNAVASSAVFGADAKVESVAIMYETEKDAEAPGFKTQPAQSWQLVAKINFRRKKLGNGAP